MAKKRKGRGDYISYIGGDDTDWPGPRFARSRSTKKAKKAVRKRKAKKKK